MMCTAFKRALNHYIYSIVEDDDMPVYFVIQRGDSQTLCCEITHSLFFKEPNSAICLMWFEALISAELMLCGSNRERHLH